jgi:hypothetical protein
MKEVDALPLQPITKAKNMERRNNDEDHWGSVLEAEAVQQ